MILKCVFARSSASKHTEMIHVGLVDREVDN